MKLSKRLMTCVKMVRPGVRVCDVGTDHGKLACYLVKEGLVTGAIATDLNAQPLLRAEETIRKNGLLGKIELVQTDGLRGIDETAVDDVVIAGMGGQLIATILADCPWLKCPSKRYLLQPMTQAPLLRRFLCEAGFALERECAVEDDGHHYTVICAKFVGTPRTLGEYEAVVGALPENFSAGGATEEEVTQTVAYLRHQAHRIMRVAEGKERARQDTTGSFFYRNLAEEILAGIPVATQD